MASISVQRKLPLAGGETVRAEIAQIRRTASDVAASGGAGFGATAERLAEAADALEAFVRRRHPRLAGGGPATRRSPARRNTCACSGSRSAERAWPKAGLAAEALAAGGDESELGRVGLARFFAEKLMTAAPGARTRDRLGRRAPRTL